MRCRPYDRAAASPLGSCQRGKWALGTGLTLRSTWWPSLHRLSQGHPHRPCRPRAIEGGQPRWLADSHGQYQPTHELARPSLQQHERIPRICLIRRRSLLRSVSVPHRFHGHCSEHNRSPPRRERSQVAGPANPTAWDTAGSGFASPTAVAGTPAVCPPAGRARPPAGGRFLTWNNRGAGSTAANLPRSPFGLLTRATSAPEPVPRRTARSRFPGPGAGRARRRRSVRQARIRRHQADEASWSR
jgi:hypothetical protein